MENTRESKEGWVHFAFNAMFAPPPQVQYRLVLPQGLPLREGEGGSLAADHLLGEGVLSFLVRGSSQLRKRR